MIILVLNCGSSSAKFQVLEMESETCVAKGIVEKIGSSNAILTYSPQGGRKYRQVKEILDHRRAIAQILEMITDPEIGCLKDSSQIKAVGHRVVHGGEKFSSSVLITEEVLHEIVDCIELAPLHNPHHVRGIVACQELLPDVPQVAVFDTAFHQTMPAEAYIYALPYVLYVRHRIRRYGFHGTSHFYVFHEAARLLGRPPEELKVITCHLGNGASVTAVQHGRSIDTSMGFTPLEGLVMGTRCGDIDPAIIPYVIEKEHLTVEGSNLMMNKHSGLLGISGVSSDLREVLKARGEGIRRADLAVRVYAYRIKKYIGAYAAAMGGLDAIVFTAGIGENAPEIRALACSGLEFLGVELDEEANARNEQRIGKGRVEVLVIPTNEELVIARDTRRIAFGG
jgi:acetate kinase